jgi:hypothetical protein
MGLSEGWAPTDSTTCRQRLAWRNSENGGIDGDALYLDLSVTVNTQQATYSCSWTSGEAKLMLPDALRCSCTPQPARFGCSTRDCCSNKGPAPHTVLLHKGPQLLVLLDAQTTISHMGTMQSLWHTNLRHSVHTARSQAV